jgi:hypothetical protein
MFQFVTFLSPLSHKVSEPSTYRGVLLSTLLQAILNTSHHLLNVLLQFANKLGLIIKKNLNSIGLSLPHRKHITSPLRAQQANAIYRFVTIGLCPCLPTPSRFLPRPQISRNKDTDNWVRSEPLTAVSGIQRRAVRGVNLRFGVTTSGSVKQETSLLCLQSALYCLITNYLYGAAILILSTHLRLGLPSGLFPSGFPTNNL